MNCHFLFDRGVHSTAVLLGLLTISSVAMADEHNTELFEKTIRPVLVERCYKCHAGDKTKGGLRLDSREAAVRGGESGAAVNPGKPDESKLLQAIRHEDGLEMPPDGMLSEQQITAFTAWIVAGAPWPDSVPLTSTSSPAGPAFAQIAPDDSTLAHSLQLWLSASTLTLNDGDPVYVWPDQSGHGRDFSATKGVRSDGVGLPGRFIQRSALQKRPAVRFETTTGLASSPDNPVEIRGDAALTIVLVMNLQPHETQPPYDGVLGIGNPANAGGDPGRPLAALVQINRSEDHALHFAGGWNHDASLGSGSFKPLYGHTTIVSVTKHPGPMRESTRLFINGEAVGGPNGEPPEGRDTIPDIQHRTDIGAYLGKAVTWAGAIQGDLGEVLVYNQALTDAQRLGVEAHLAEKFGLILRPLDEVTLRATFTDAEKNHWAYQLPKDSSPPAVANNAWIQSPLDRFILAGLEAQHLTPTPPADRLTLLRRASFDLIGLPPTPGEVDAFLQDESPQAFETVVDRLLQSPHYGEHWGRHWLDVVRYAETTANDANAVMRYAWRYRNYVIDSFNHDLPYDQFLIEQLAGDLLPETDSIELNTRRVIATGFLMIGPKALAETDKEQSRLDIVDDQIDVTSRAMLGLTVSCARCHDHKFDAIRTADYYALAGIFRSTEPFQNENRNATMWWEFPVSQAPGQQPVIVMAPKEALPRNLRIHLRGNRFTLGASVPRGVIQILADSSSTASPVPVIENSGRLELARWIASSQNPLTARVMVNRIWQHHFGRGLVETSDNFGVRGERPTHPELLDWLAARFVETGWSMKAMHRLIMLSSTYQQRGVTADATEPADLASRWLSSFPRRRLSAEEQRDAMLAISGNLDRVPGGSESGEYLVSKAEDIGAMILPNRLAADDPIYTTFAKRTIYLPVVRNMLPDVLTLFDAADPNGVTAVRNETIVASQALFLLNSAFVREQAKQFGQQLLGDDSISDNQRIAAAHRLVFGRKPSPEELAQAKDFLEAYLAAPVVQARPESERRLSAWQSYCQVLFCENDFLYLD